MPAKTEEKRRFPRIDLKAALRYQIRGTSVFNTCLSDDISLGGLGFTDSNFISPQTNLMLEISVLSHLITPIGRVAWASPIPHTNDYRLGVEFVELEQPQKKYLADYIDMQLGKL